MSLEKIINDAWENKDQVNQSSDQNLKELLFNKDPNKLSSIQSIYDGTRQSFEMKFRYNNKNIANNIRIIIISNDLVCEYP